MKEAAETPTASVSSLAWNTGSPDAAVLNFLSNAALHYQTSESSAVRRATITSLWRRWRCARQRYSKRNENMNSINYSSEPQLFILKIMEVNVLYIYTLWLKHRTTLTQAHITTRREIKCLFYCVFFSLNTKNKVHQCPVDGKHPQNITNTTNSVSIGIIQ